MSPSLETSLRKRKWLHHTNLRVTLHRLQFCNTTFALLLFFFQQEVRVCEITHILRDFISWKERGCQWEKCTCCQLPHAQTCCINLKRTDGMNTTADSFSISGYERSTEDSWISLRKCSLETPWVNVCNWISQDLQSQLCFLCLCSLTFIKTVELQGFGGSSCWGEFSQMKEQLDEMNIPSRPGCWIWYSYRHTTGRRLNKHYGLVKNMTSRSSSSAAVTRATTSQSAAGRLVGTPQHYLVFILPPPHNLHLRMYFFTVHLQDNHLWVFFSKHCKP